MRMRQDRGDVHVFDPQGLSGIRHPLRINLLTGCEDPLVAMQRGTEPQRTVVRHAIENGAVDELEQIVAIVRETGALDATREAAAAEAQRAIDHAKQLPANSWSQGMLQLAAQLLTRRT